MAKDLPRAAGEAGAKTEAVSAAELFMALAEIIRWWSVTDDAMGTNEALVRAVLKAVATHKREGQIVHVDEAGRRVTARHLRLGAASERLMEGLKAYKKGLGDLASLEAEILADFTLDIRGFLHDKVAKNAGASRKVKDIASLASQVVSLAAKRRDPDFKAASPRFIQATRSLYKSASKTVERSGKRIRDAVAAGLPPPRDTEAEQKEEHHAAATKMGFEQPFTWQEDPEATPEEASKSVGHFRYLLYRLGGEEAMRTELYTLESCAAYILKVHGLDAEHFSVVPQLKAQAPQPVYFRQLLCVGHSLDAGHPRVSCCGRLGHFSLGSFPNKAVEHNFEDVSVSLLNRLAHKRSKPSREHACRGVVPNFFKLAHCSLQKRSPNLSNFAGLYPRQPT